MNMKCKDNDNFEFDRRVNHGCGFNFELSSDEIYQIGYIDCLGEEKEEFYTMCPRCGYIVPLDISLLEDYEINLARRKSIDDNTLFLKNNILSEYQNVVERSKIKKKTI